MSSFKSDQLHVEDIIIAASSKHHGIALWPPPSSDVKDPLRWPRSFKLLAMLAVSLFNFVGNFAGAGLSVATPILEMQFQKTASEVNALLTFNFLLLGLGNFIWVPLSVKFGKRAILLISMAIHTAALAWTARAGSFNSLLAARCVTGFSAAAGESIVPGIVSDIFFLHERASMMAIYVIFISGATAVGPLIGSFMVARLPGTWRDYTWLCMALSILCSILIFLFYPESTYKRPLPEQPLDITMSRKSNTSNLDDKDDNRSAAQEEVMPSRGQDVQTVQIKWLEVWSSSIFYNPSVSFARTFLCPLALIGLPAVLWASLIYGTALAAQITMIFAFPSFLMAPPYLFTSEDVGLIQVAAIIGFAIACFGGGYVSDLIVIRMIKRNGNHFFPEQRLLSLFPGFWVSPVGCIVIAVCCSQKLSWIGVAFGFGMLSFGTVYSPNIAVTYVADSFPRVSAECLVTINAFKNLVAFLFLYVAVDWVQSRGWVEVYMIMFMLTTLAPLCAGGLYLWRRAVGTASDRILQVTKTG